MPSFDIVSETDLQKLDNAVNTARREMVSRFDFHHSKTEINLDKKDSMIYILTENDMRMDAVEGILIARMVRQGLESSCLDFGKEKYASGNMVKKDIRIKKGIDKDNARKLIKIIKDSGKKVQASIMDEQIRVTGKKLDDLQEVISMIKKTQVDLPLQFTNFRN